MSAFNRRRFLTGMGGIVLALPWLERFAGRAEANTTSTGPKRIIVMTYQMGIPVAAWRPSATGSNFTLPYVTAPLEPWRSRCAFISDIDNSVLDRGGDSFKWGHPGKGEAALTGTLTKNVFRTPNTNHIDDLIPGATASASAKANGPSVEHVIGQKLFRNHPFPGINLAVDGGSLEGEPAPDQEPRSRFFFEGADAAVKLHRHPSSALNTYFASVPAATGDTAATTALRELRERNKSVLDAVRESYATVARDLGADDRRRLEEHAARIRSLELDTQQASSCIKPTGINDGRNQAMNTLAPQHIRILGQAMACNLAPVGRIEFLRQQNPRFGISALDSMLDATQSKGYDWHNFTHGFPVPGSSANTRGGYNSNNFDQRLLDGYRFFVQQFAALLKELDSHTEGTGTVLDNTLCVLASDFGEGLAHYHGKMGYILAGNLGGGRTNYHLRCSSSSASFYTQSNYEVVQLLNSICDMAGVSNNGTPISMGLGGHLSRAGRPRRIDALFA